MASSEEESVNYPQRVLFRHFLLLSEVYEKIHELRLELSARTLQLGNVQAKYDRSLVEGAHAAREIAQLRAALERQRESYAQLNSNYDRLVRRLSSSGGPSGLA